MIKSLRICNFKSFVDEEIHFGKLSIFAGTNSSGKSSVIHSILLMMQIFYNNYGNAQNFNGSLIKLGKFRQLKNRNMNDEEIQFFMDFDRNFEELIQVSFFENNSIKFLSGEDFLFDLILNDDYEMSYISSNRVAVSDIYENKLEEKFFTFNNTMGYFQKYKDDKINDELIIDKSAGETLNHQVNYWLDYILGSTILTESVGNDSHIVLKFQSGEVNNIMPINIGTGNSYLLSILIGGLKLKPGDLFIVENPEIHLHPKAQSLLVEFFSHLSNSGVQVIIETHSDHIFNGVRRHLYKKTLNFEDLKVSFFTLGYDFNTKVEMIKLNQEGRILNHSDGLFDQFTIDLNILLGLE